MIHGIDTPTVGASLLSLERGGEQIADLYNLCVLEKLDYTPPQLELSFIKTVEGAKLPVGTRILLHFGGVDVRSLRLLGFLNDYASVEEITFASQDEKKMDFILEIADMTINLTAEVLTVTDELASEEDLATAKNNTH